MGRRIQAGANTRRKVEEVMLDRNIIEKAERESPESVCYIGMPAWSGDSGIDRTTKTEAACL